MTKENTSLGFGIVEFDNAEDTEKAFDEFNKHDINGVAININYCIPGKSAVHMFNRIMFKYVSILDSLKCMVKSIWKKLVIRKLLKNPFIMSNPLN